MLIEDLRDKINTMLQKLFQKKTSISSFDFTILFIVRKNKQENI